jgi:putative copper resistance protein D
VYWLHDAYLISVWLHILAAATWIGGMFFVALVVVPSLRKGDRAYATKLLGESGRRFRAVGWTCFAVLFVTGCFNLFARGVTLYDFFDRDWVASPFGRAVVLKVSIFAVVLVLSAVHDYSIGPRAVAELERDPESALSATLRRRASIIGRVNALLAIALVALAVILVRGWPAW